jgi:hypothetical protein
MLNDIECEVIGSAKAPHREGQQQDNFEGEMFQDKQHGLN